VPQMRPKGFETHEPFDRLWVEADPAKFPSGLKSLANRINDLGLTPGIWIGMYLPLRPGFEGYVTDDQGQPYRGPWVNYAADATVRAAVDEAYLRTITGLREQGWRYFKLDTLRHVLYDNYRLNEHFWKAKGTDSSHAFRSLFAEYRKAVGDDIYCLACWGTLPEIAGLPDGCRIGEDVGPNWKSIELVGKYVAQFNDLNNVVWRNDPDYMCFDMPIEQCRFWASLVALTCSQLMVSDKMHVYDEDRLEILRRIGPPLFGRPRVVAPVDRPEIWTLQTETHMLVGRFAWTNLPARPLLLLELGLDSDADYFAWDFWKEEQLGTVRNSIQLEELPAKACQVISLSPADDRPFTWPK
jgi:alpha-galactosidase